MFGLGIAEISIILVVALLVLGPKRLPDAARSLGRSMAEFRRASNEIRNALVLESTPEPGPPQAAPKPPPALSQRSDRDAGKSAATKTSDEADADAVQPGSTASGTTRDGEPPSLETARSEPPAVETSAAESKVQEPEVPELPGPEGPYASSAPPAKPGPGTSSGNA